MRSLLKSMAAISAGFIRINRRLCSKTCISGQYSPTEVQGQNFFGLMRKYTVMGYYTSRIGLEELDYPGLNSIPPLRNVHIRDDPEHRIFRPPRKSEMPKQIYDVIVIGTGAGGGMAIHALCKAGAKVCALNGSRRLDPRKDFRNHKQPYDMKFRGFG